MKVLITINEDNIEGYLKISPMLGHYLNDISNLVEDNECLEILAPTIINYLPFNQLQQIITGWVSKLRHGGKIVLGGTDLYEISKRVTRGEIDTDLANVLIYGQQTGVWDVKRSQLNLKDVSDLLSHLGLKIITKKLDGIDMVVEAIRP